MAKDTKPAREDETLPTVDAASTKAEVNGRTWLVDEDDVPSDETEVQRARRAIGCVESRRAACSTRRSQPGALRCRAPRRRLSRSARAQIDPENDPRTNADETRALVETLRRWRRFARKRRKNRAKTARAPRG